MSMPASRWEIISQVRTMYFRPMGRPVSSHLLGVDDFIKRSSIVYYSKDALEAVHEDIIRFAKAEQLTAHANSIAVRFEKKDEE